VIGIDPDPKALSRARRKAAKAAVSIQFDQGFGDNLPYTEASFDRVFSSFMFHHLPPAEKGNTLCAVRRVLKPSGRFHMLDFEGPESGSNGVLAHLLHSSMRLKENSESRVLSLMRQSGFADPRKIERRGDAVWIHCLLQSRIRNGRRSDCHRSISRTWERLCKYIESRFLACLLQNASLRW
jgi:SAM-dependent methyltransferase